MKMMKACVFENKELKIKELPVPECGDDEVLVKVESCLMEESRISADGRVPGRFFAGTVEYAGKRAVSAASGDRVVCDGRIPCGSCRNCRRGRERDCVNVITAGTDIDGGMAHYAVIKGSAVYRIPDDLSFEKSVLAGPCSEAIAALDKIHRKSMYVLAIAGNDDDAVILAQLSRFSDAGRVIFFSENKKCLEKAAAEGIKACLLPEDPQKYSECIAKNAGRLNAAVDATGNNRIARALMDNVAGGGVLLLYGKAKEGREEGLEFEDARDFFFRICFIETSEPKAGFFTEGLEAVVQKHINTEGLLPNAVSINKIV